MSATRQTGQSRHGTTRESATMIQQENGITRNPSTFPWPSPDAPARISLSTPYRAQGHGNSSLTPVPKRNFLQF
ncbi:hypothetical protein ACUNV4_01510 [Granulosicoccus sp. 3-233]|uniref:hypothetical protein n=1 Tax=Granulosicoccus sp. 3-233 TaxID=3417969 RepID=UPI003D33AC6E